MAQNTVTAEVKNPDGTTFRQVIRPDYRYFKGDINTLCKDMFQNALVSINKPILQNTDESKKDLEVKV